MITQKIPRWTGAAVLAVLGIVVLVLFVVAWLSSNQIRSDWLTPVADERPYDIEVVRTPPSRLVIAGTDEPPRGGIWGFESQATYTQLTALLNRTETDTEWAATPYVGEIAVGVRGAWMWMRIPAIPRSLSVSASKKCERRGTSDRCRRG